MASVVKSLSLLFCVYLTLDFSLASLKLPHYLTPCSHSSPNLNECALNAARAAIPYLLKGDPKYHLPNLVPLEIPEIKMNANGNIVVKFKNVKIYGLESIEFLDFKFDSEEFSITSRSLLPRASLIGKYDIKGKILVLPIVGTGPGNITLIDTIYDFKHVFKLVERNGKNYTEIIDDSVKYDCKRAYFKFDNLFNGDKRLGNQMNALLNENWKDVMKDMGEAVTQTMKSLTRLMFLGIMDRVPYNEIFLP